MPDTDPDRVPVEELAAEYVDRRRRGETPTVEEYAARYPDMAEEIHELFPAVEAVEQLKAHSERDSDGRATLGPVKLARLGDFRIVREIGRGGMGVVYEAQQESLDRRVALKVLPREALHDRRQLARFKREARLAARLHHTNIVQVYAVGEADRFHYYAMQFVHGVGLDSVIARIGEEAPTDEDITDGKRLLDAACRELGAEPGGGPVGPSYFRRVARLGMSVARALAYAHSQGTLHRDIKPGNLLLDDAGTVWVTDFGLARSDRSPDPSKPGTLAGTLRYMAPERFEGPAGAAADIYCLGLTVWELLTGAPVFDEPDRTELVRRIREGDTPPPRAANPAIPRDLEKIVLKAAAPDPERRYASAAAMADDLQRFLEDMPVAARPISAPERLARWCRRNRMVAALSGATFLLAVLVAVVATTGYLRTRTALQREAAERDRAESVVALSLDALDRIFDRMAPAGSPSRMEFTLDADGTTSVEVYTPPPLAAETVRMLEEMLPIYDRLAAESGSDEVVARRAADAARRIGDIHQRLGNYEDALAAYTRALRLAGTLPGAALLQAEVLNETGRTWLLANDPAEARAAHVDALDVLAQAPDAGEPAVVFERARTHYLLGTRPQGDPRPQDTREPRGPRGRRQPLPAPDDRGERLEHIGSAIELLDGLDDATETARLLALCYRELAMLQRATDPAASDAALARAVAIQQGLADAHPAEPTYRFDLAETHLAHAETVPGGAPTAESTDDGRRALALAEELARDYPTVPEYRALLARACHVLADQLWRAGEEDEARGLAERAVAVQADLSAELPGIVAHAAWLGAYRNGLADMLLMSRDFRSAQALLAGNADALEQLLREQPDMWYLHGLLAETYRRVARLNRRIGNADAASEADAMAEQHGGTAGRQARRGPGQGRGGMGPGGRMGRRLLLGPYEER